MLTNSFSGRRLLPLALLSLLSFTARAELVLGEPPVAPIDVSGLPRQTEKVVSNGFTVNIASREQVRSFYNAVYMASEGVPMGSTADTANCVAGTTAADWKDAVLRRINWYRAMAGIPATVTLNATFSAKDQAAALMMSRNNTLDHYPTTSWLCWSSDGTNAAANSNLGLGTSGPDTVTGYIQDPGSGNGAAGHRRWLLYPQTQIMGTGDVPAQGTYAPANAVWVFDGNYGGTRPATRTPYVAWPPPGYVPHQVVFPRWSLSFPGASFSAATVTMRSNGVPLFVSLENVVTGAGENSLVWVPMGLDTLYDSTLWPFNGSDTVYSVGVSNVIVNSRATNFNYTVTVFDPFTPGADYAPTVLAGPAQPVVGRTNGYSFNSLSNATSYQWRCAQRMPLSFFDGAEAGLGNFTPSTAPGYFVISNTLVASGSRAFQLGHLENGGLWPQILTLNTLVAPLTNSVLQFKSQLRYATADEVARVEVSTNDGPWFAIYSQPGDNFGGESVWSLRSLPLGGFTGASLRIRFNYFFSTGGFYPGVDTWTGWHIDDIAISNAVQLVAAVTNNLAVTNFLFFPLQAADYALQARPLIYTDFPLDWSSIKAVTAVTLPPVFRVGRIAVSNTVARIDFTVQSGTASSFKLLQAAQVGGPWSTNSAAVLTTNAPGSQYRFTATVGAAPGFYRVQTP